MCFHRVGGIFSASSIPAETAIPRGIFYQSCGRVDKHAMCPEITFLLNAFTKLEMPKTSTKHEITCSGIIPPAKTALFFLRSAGHHIKSQDWSGMVMTPPHMSAAVSCCFSYHG
jgi:hypothetical protein